MKQELLDIDAILSIATAQLSQPNPDIAKARAAVDQARDKILDLPGGLEEAEKIDGAHFIFPLRRHQEVGQVFWFIPVFGPRHNTPLHRTIKLLVSKRTKNRPGQKSVDPVNNAGVPHFHFVLVNARDLVPRNFLALRQVCRQLPSDPG